MTLALIGCVLAAVTVALIGLALRTKPPSPEDRLPPVEVLED